MRPFRGSCVRYPLPAPDFGPAIVVGVAQLVELLVVVQAVVGSSPIVHPVCSVSTRAGVAELVDAPGLGPGGETRGGSSPLTRTYLTTLNPVGESPCL